MGDTKESISLTNLAMVALVIKMLATPNLDWPSVITMITVFANYAHKRDTRKTEEITVEQQVLTKTIEDQAKTIEEYRQKIMPAIDLIKGKI